MRSKQVSKRLAAVAEVRASLQAHRGAVGKLLDHRPAAHGNFSQPYFDHLDTELATVENTLVAAEDRHTQKLVRVARLRRESQELTAALFDKQAALRQVLMGLYGTQSDFELAAASGRTPRAPETLAEQVDQTIKLLRDPVLAPPDMRIVGIHVDFDDLADDLEVDLQQLRQVRADLQHTLKKTDGTRAVVKAAIEEFNGVFSWAARNLESTFRLAGEKELADRVRTSRRRAASRAPEDKGEPPAANEKPSSEVASRVEKAASSARAADPAAPELPPFEAKTPREIDAVKSVPNIASAEASTADVGSGVRAASDPGARPCAPTMPIRHGSKGETLDTVPKSIRDVKQHRSVSHRPTVGGA